MLPKKMAYWRERAIRAKSAMRLLSYALLLRRALLTLRY